MSESGESCSSDDEYESDDFLSDSESENSSEDGKWGKFIDISCYITNPFKCKVYMFPKVFLELILNAPRFTFASFTNSPWNRLCWIHVPCTSCDIIIFLRIKDTSSCTWLKGKRTFKQCQSSLDENLFLLLSSDPTMLKLCLKHFKPNWSSNGARKGKEERRKRNRFTKGTEALGIRLKRKAYALIFCTCPNYVSWYLAEYSACGREGRKVRGLKTALGVLLAFHSQIVTRKGSNSF